VSHSLLAQPVSANQDSGAASVLIGQLVENLRRERSQTNWIPNCKRWSGALVLAVIVIPILIPMRRTGREQQPLQLRLARLHLLLRV
jgi:ABC-type phosphate transport system permease subunit